MLPTWQGHLALPVPYFPQETEDTCAIACLLMALAFLFPDQSFLEAELAKQCRCLRGVGALVTDVYRTACKYTRSAQWLTNTDIERQVAAALAAGSPVLANVQLRELPYLSPQPLQAWHSVLIVAMDGHAVYLHDPDPQEGGPRRAVKRVNFFARWAIQPYSAFCL